MSDHLPEEVVVEILKRLPLKCVVKCRSVCKNWNSLITSPSFISSHLQTSLSNPNSQFFLLRLFKNDEENFFLHFDNDDFDEFMQLHFPVEGCLNSFDVVGSCNGLICLRFVPQHIIHLVLWNPSIQKHITLPETSINCSSNNSYLIFGFGFDSRSNDYKILIVSGERGELFTEAHLFSLNGNYWNRVTSIYPSYAVDGAISSTFVNGVVHWLAYQRGHSGAFENAVVGFDLDTEQFLVIKLPDGLVDLCPMDLSIMKYEESSIAILRRDWEDGEQLHVWVMKEYGSVESWTKVLYLTDHSGILPKVCGFRQNGEVLVEVDHGEMASLDLNCQQMEYLGINASSKFPIACSYVESLVLLDKWVDNGTENDDSISNDSDAA